MLTPLVSKLAVGSLIALGLIGAPLAYEAANSEGDGPNAANKTSIASSAIKVFGPDEVETLLSTSIKTAAPTDLVLQVTAECDIVTQVTTVGNDFSEAAASIRMWLTLDGAPIVVNSAEDGEDSGKVTFCDRLHSQKTTDFDDDDATISQFIETRSAHGFNWVALDVGSGTHTIELLGTLVESTSGDAEKAEAAVGKRTLIVEPMFFEVGTTN